jgi:hypothetical protein
MNQKEYLIEIRGHGRGTQYKKIPKSYTYTKTSIPTTIDCFNPICKEGGIVIASVASKMNKEGLTEVENTQLCQGKLEAKILCATEYKVKISITS